MLQKLDPIVAEFREWLSGKTGKYDYDHCRECAFAQFLKHKHGDKANVVVTPYTYAVGDDYAIIPAPLHAQLRVGNFARLRELIDTGALF